MPDKFTDASTAARQVILAVGRLDSLATVPSVAAQILSRLLQGPFSPSVFADVIESDPALMAMVLSVIDRQGLNIRGQSFSLRGALDRLPPDVLRDALLSVKVCRRRAGEDTLSRTELILHSLAVACCAGSIAEAAGIGVDADIAYCAGLLHDIGKLALAESMPKSFARIIAEAQSTESGSQAIEQRHLGADHAILGKRLAQKWRLPDEIAMAIWLHHSDTAAIAQTMPEARIAQVVQLADSVARSGGIGQSGSYDPPESIEKNALSLGISIEQLQQMLQNLLGQVAEKSNALGLDSPDAVADYGDAAHSAAAQLARQQSELSAENRRLQIASTHLDFATDFLLSINSTTGPVDVAEEFAGRWQRFYQTGAVCLYLAPAPGSRELDVVVVEGLGESRTLCLELPDGVSAVPKAIAGTFGILDAHDHIGWLLDQLDVDFGAGQTKLAPLLSAGRAVGAIAFELNYPGDAALFAEKFEASASIGGAVLDMALGGARNQTLAERFAQLVSSDIAVVAPVREPAQGQGPAADPVEALAELAAGAAHELNNPLAVVCGRTQLLAEAETDPQKKEILNQINRSATEASGIISDLMSFAEPPAPRAGRADVRQILDESLQLARRKTHIEDIDVRIEVADGAGSVFVDSAQIASAIANVVANAVESYSDEIGPIKITAESVGAGEFVRVLVSDRGCGMSAETLRKATQPFFSAKQAGRKRGMGLAYAARFVQMNGGTLEIESQAGAGTSVWIHLPCG